jgi:single-strand DNA-binding protein
MPPDFDKGGVMNNLNSILIEGNLVRDPMLRATPKGTQVCSMSLASNRYYKQEGGYEKEVSFFDVETWSRLAELCYNKGKKGRGVRVVGRLKQNRWSDPDGKQRSKVSIIAEHVEFRPEFKKDGKQNAPAAAVENSPTPYVGNLVDEDYNDEEYDDEDESALAMAGKELESTAF